MHVNKRLIQALLCEKVDRTPVWIMRQAGRYLPEYREIRERAGNFLTLCKTPELACQVTLQPLQRFPLDAAILFSDILTIPDAYGLGLYFEEGEGPCFKKPIRTLTDIQALPTIDPEIELRYVMDTIRMLQHELGGKLPLIGFAGSPWTIATYMVEGKASKNFNSIRRLGYQEPEILHQLLQHLSQSITDYLSAQIASGVDVVMLFDTWGGILNKQDYLTFSLQYMSNIIQELQKFTKQKKLKKIPIILFTKNGGQHLLEIANSQCDAIGLDWTANLQKARQLLDDSIREGKTEGKIEGEIEGKTQENIERKIALQGNLDPAVLYAKPSVIQQAVKKVLAEHQDKPGHIFNLGHGIPSDVSLDSVYALIEAVQE